MGGGAEEDVGGDIQLVQRPEPAPHHPHHLQDPLRRGQDRTLAQARGGARQAIQHTSSIFYL